MTSLSFRRQMLIEPGEHELAGIGLARMPLAMHVEREILRLSLELVHVHDLEIHENPLPLGERVAVIESRQVEKRPRRDESDDLMHVNGGQSPFEHSRTNVFEVNVPMVASPGVGRLV